MSQVRILTCPFVCRNLSPRYTRLCLLALGGLRFVKTIINRFSIAHIPTKEEEMTPVVVSSFLMDSNLCVPANKTEGVVFCKTAIILTTKIHCISLFLLVNTMETGGR